MEYRIKKSYGSIAWVYDKAGIEYKQENVALRIHGRISNITEKKRKEIQLDQTEKRFETITGNLPFPFILSSENDLKPIYSNFTFNAVFKNSSSKGDVGENLWIDDLLPLESKDDYLKFLYSNSNFSNFEILLNSKEGQQWCSLSSQLIPYKLGNARALIFYNINKRKLSELELIRMNDVIQAINQTQMDFSMDNEIQDTFYMLLKSLVGFTESSFGFLGEVLYDEKGMTYLKSNTTSNIAWNEKILEYYQKNSEQKWSLEILIPFLVG